MKCKFCGRETDKDYEVCSECEKSLTVAINKNRKKNVKAKHASNMRGITSLVCAIIALTKPFGIIISFICGMVAIFFGNYAKPTAGASLGKVGKTLGIVSLTSCVITLLMRLIITAIFVTVSVMAIITFIFVYPLL